MSQCDISRSPEDDDLERDPAYVEEMTGRGQSGYLSTTNACKLCKPLGATVAFKGVEGAIPFLHGSQGCATYMRRYIISHFREPMDIASSALGEKSAVYGGGPNLKAGILNSMKKYGAKLVGVATTCLTETIGDDVPMILKQFRDEFGAEHELPDIVHVSTPSYSGTHMEGFHAAVKALVAQLVQPAKGETSDALALFPGFVSPEDIRHLKDILDHFGLTATILPDYSDTLDGPALEDYEKISSGGTPIAAIKALGSSKAGLEFGATMIGGETPGTILQSKHGVPLTQIATPIGLRASDAFFEALETLSGRCVPERYVRERGRLIDSLVDGHKYISGKRVVIYGEEDLTVGLTALAVEIGLKPVLVATGGNSGRFAASVAQVCEGLYTEPVKALDNVDFFDIACEVEDAKPDLIMGHSKGYKIAGKHNIPLIRLGFPIHDRFGAQRVLHIGYLGMQRIFDAVVNAVIEKKQADSDVGYGYI